MSVAQLVTSFNAGELSPYLDVRSDLEKYASGCRELENFIIMPYGGVYRRPGTEYLGAAKHADKRCRLIGFNYSTTTYYVLEMGVGYFRFWLDGALIEASPGVVYEIVSPYKEEELREVQYIQINDVMYLVHPNHAPHKLARQSGTEWSLAKVEWDWPALLDENVTEATISASALTGADITLTASEDVFKPGHVGGYFAIGHRREEAYVEKALTAADGDSGVLDVIDEWELTTYGNWNGTLKVRRSLDGGTTWETIRTYKNASEGERNVATTGREESLCKLKLVWDGATGGTLNPNARLSAGENKIFGVVRITEYDSATIVRADVVRALNSTSATKYWCEGAWSEERGYPRTVAFHEQRVMYGGTQSRPQSIWGSVVDDFENFRQSSNDDAGLFFTLSAREANVIQWMLSQNQLLIGTAGNEWTLGSSERDGGLTPTNVKADQQSSYGSKYMRAVMLNDVVLFVQRQGRKVRELVYSYEKDGWVAPDLTLLAEHVTKGELVECAFQQQPDAIYWGITGGGDLVGMTYEREQNVVGWHRHSTGVREDGKRDAFESVSTTYGANGADEVWFCVKRTINGLTRRYIERFRPDVREALEAGDKSKWWYLDCAKRVLNEVPTATVDGLGHLEGEEVQIMANGWVAPDRLVSDEMVELPNAAGLVLVGLGYESRLSPMKFEMALADGSTRGRVKRVSRMIASVYKTLGGEFSSDGENWDWIYARFTNDLMDQSPAVYTGDREVYVAGNSSRAAVLCLRQRQPHPLTVLGLVARYGAYGE